MLKIKYEDFQKISKKIDYKYFGNGMTYGALRVYSTDNDGIEHSLVLTRAEAKKYIGENLTNMYVTTVNQDYKRLFNNRPYYTYEEQEEEMKNAK